MNPLLKAGEISYTWTDCGAKVAVVFPLFAEEAAKAADVTGTDVIVTTPGEFERPSWPAPSPSHGVAERAAEDTAVILYTSGTTGQPKGAELTHANLCSNVRTTIETLLPMAPGRRGLRRAAAVPLLRPDRGLNAAMAGGACLTLLPKFDGEQALAIVAGDRVTVFLGVPTMYMALLAVPDRERFDTSAPEAGRVRRGVAAAGGAPRGRAGLRHHPAGGLRPVRDLAGGLVQPSRPADQAGLGGHAAPRRRVRPARRERRRGRARTRSARS